MSEAIGPRTYLVGCILTGIAVRGRITFAEIENAIANADYCLDRMQWPDGKPETNVDAMICRICGDCRPCPLHEEKLCKNL